MKKLKPEYEADADNYQVFRPILRKLLEKGCSQDDPFIAELLAKDKKQGEVERQAAIEKWKIDEPDKYGIYLKQNGRADDENERRRLRQNVRQH